MAALLLELSSLEAESPEVVTRTTQQEESLDTLTTMECDVMAVLTKNGILPVNSYDDPPVFCCGRCCCSFCNQ